MGGPLVVAHLKTVGGELRQKQIGYLKAASDYAKKNEPGVLKYAVFDAADSADDKSIFVIEQYADQETFDSHMSTQGVKDMIAFMTSNPVLDGTPAIYMLEFVEGLLFSRPEVMKTSDPYVIFGELVYKPDTVSESFPYWQNVVKTSQDDEPSTLVYGIAKDPKDATKLYTVEVYENESALKDVHVKSKAIEESIKNTKHLRESLKHTILKLNTGYLHR